MRRRLLGPLPKKNPPPAGTQVKYSLFSDSLFSPFQLRGEDNSQGNVHHRVWAGGAYTMYVRYSKGRSIFPLNRWFQFRRFETTLITTNTKKLIPSTTSESTNNRLFKNEQRPIIGIDVLDQQIFQNIEDFESFSISENGSLIQRNNQNGINHEDSLDNNDSDTFNDYSYDSWISNDESKKLNDNQVSMKLNTNVRNVNNHQDDEELNLNIWDRFLLSANREQSLKSEKPARTIRNNPIEYTGFKLIRQFMNKTKNNDNDLNWINDFKSQFTMQIENENENENENGHKLQTEFSLDKGYESIPTLPHNLTTHTLNVYLHKMNQIDLKYHVNKYKIINVMIDLIKNVVKFESIVDMKTMQEFLNFFSTQKQINYIFLTLDTFEKMSIFPNRESLHLILYNLNKISNYTSRIKLFKLYLPLALHKWKITTNINTKLITALSVYKSGKIRLSLLKGLINEGINYKDIKWEIIEDIININIEKDFKTDFDHIFKYIKIKKMVDNEDIGKVYDLYIKLLIDKNKVGYLINYEGIKLDKYLDLIINKLIDGKNIWGCIAILNKMTTKTQKEEICQLLLKRCNTVYQIIKLNEKDSNIYFSLLNFLIPNLSHTKFNNYLIERATFRNVENTNIINFENIKIWNSYNDSNYSRYDQFLDEDITSERVFKLYNVLHMERKLISMGYLCVDPISHPFELSPVSINQL